MKNLFYYQLTIKSFVFSVSCLSICASTAFASSFNVGTSTLKIPETNILEAARKLVPQSGPYYSVKGTLTCGQVTRELSFEPFFYDVSACFITLGDKIEFVNNSDEIVAVLQSVKPRIPEEGWTFTAEFSAKSVSREFPPYTVTSSAEVDYQKKNY